MEEMTMPVQKPIKITETVLRDAHQSLIATRMPTELMLPIVDKMDKVGYHSVECWGGATFDASLRFCASCVTVSKIPNCKCCSVDRISSDIVTMQMMW